MLESTLREMCRRYKSVDPDIKEKMIEEIRKYIIIISKNKQDVWNSIPRSIILEDAIWLIYPQEHKFNMLLACIADSNDQENRDLLIKRFVDYARTKRYPQERVSLLQKLPVLAQFDKDVLSLLSSSGQADLVFGYFTQRDLQENWQYLWSQLPWQTQLLCVYKAAKESLLLEPLENIRSETNPITKFALIILWAKQNPDKASKAFLRAHDVLEKYIIDSAWSTTQPLDLSFFLPTCVSYVIPFCEGRIWPTERDIAEGKSKVSRAFCPRRRQACSICNELEEYDFGGIATSQLLGARIYPECERKWEDWSVIELFSACNVLPIVPGLKNAEEYTTKLAGWINRLNEIRERLKCSKCGSVMTTNKEYAKLLARFNATVFKCSENEAHETVYINVCWACEKIIDSRESRFQLKSGGYYLCIHCGSGPKESDSYTQGSICPNCGSNQLLRDKKNRRLYKCKVCSHEIQVPEQLKITGLKEFDIFNNQDNA